MEKTYLYNADKTEMCRNFYNYLIANAVPEYFDSVTINEENCEVHCFVGENEFMTLKTHHSNSKTIYVGLTTTNDMFSTYTPNTTNGIGYVYKCGSSISFCTDSGVSNRNNTFCCTITKDNDGNTTVIVLSGFKIQTGTSISTVYSASAISQAIASHSFIVYNANAIYLTSTVPMFAGDTSNYTPDVMLLPYAQNTSAGYLQIGSEKYISNGLWACKDEETD